MPYYRSTVVNAGEGEDKVREAILKLDSDLTNIFVYIDVHEVDTDPHGVTGVIVGEAEVQTLTNKTLTAPVIVGGTMTLLTALSIANNVDMGDYQVRLKQLYADVATGTAPFVVDSATLVTNLNVDLLRGNSAPTGAMVGTTDIQTLTAKTLTSAVFNTSLTGTSIKDEDNMVSDSAEHLATQQSIKAYVDSYPSNLTNLVTAEIQQLEVIGTETISAAQWGYLGGFQSLVPAALPTFAGITLNGDWAGTGIKDEDNMVSNSAVALATQQSIKAYLDATCGGELVYVSKITASAKDMYWDDEPAPFRFTGLADNVHYMIVMSGWQNHTSGGNGVFGCANGYGGTIPAEYKEHHGSAYMGETFWYESEYGYNYAPGEFTDIWWDCGWKDELMFVIFNIYSTGTIVYMSWEWVGYCADHPTYGENTSGGVMRCIYPLGESLSYIDIGHGSDGVSAFTGTMWLFKRAT